MTFELTDLLPVKELPIVHPRDSILKIGELLINKKDEKFSGYDGRDEIGTTSYGTNLYFIGSLNDLRAEAQEKPNIRVSKKRIKITTYAVLEGDTKAELKRSEKIKEEMEKKYPQEGDILLVYWFSKNHYPARFRGEVYAHASTIPATDPDSHVYYIFRRPADPLNVYIPKALSRLPQKVDYINQPVLESLANQMGSIGKGISDYLSLNIAEYKKLILRSTDEIKEHTLINSISREDILELFESYKDRTPYKNCLSALASLNIKKTIAWTLLYNSMLVQKFKGEVIKDNRNIDELISDFFDTLYNEIDPSFKGIPIEKPILPLDVRNMVYTAFGKWYSKVFEQQVSALAGFMKEGR